MNRPHINATQSNFLVRSACHAIVPLVTTLVACSGEMVTMGEDGNGSGPLPTSSRCIEDTTVREGVVVSTQEHLDALEGCQVIEGSLVLFNFDADLRPLHALTTVRGDLSLDMYGWPGTFPLVPLLESLEGLESLRSVRNLELIGLLADNLDPLGNLEVLTGGSLTISASPNLRTLGGLSRLEGVDNLLLKDCAALEDINFTLPEMMESLVIESTKLDHLSPLSVASILGPLSIIDTALQNLDAFELADASLITISNNRLLSNVDALNSLGGTNLSIRDNPNLTHLPEFSNLNWLSSLSVISNERLANIPAFRSDFRVTAADPLTLGGLSSAGAIITDNPALTAISLTPLWLGASALIIANNPALEQVTFTEQSSVQYLNFTNNPALRSLDIGVLQTVNLLEVDNNPYLDMSAFDGVRTFETSTSSSYRP